MILMSHCLGALKAPGVTLAFPLRPVHGHLDTRAVMARGSGEDVSWIVEGSEDGINWTADAAPNTASGNDIEKRAELTVPKDWLRIRVLKGREVDMTFVLEA